MFLTKVREQPWFLFLIAFVLFLAPLIPPRSAMAEGDKYVYPKGFANLEYYRLNTTHVEERDTDTASRNDTVGNAQLADSEEPQESGSTIHLGSLHKYLGYGALAAAAGSLITGAITPEDSIHPALSYVAMGLGGAACTTGALEYWDLLDIDEGISTYNAHAILGSVSTVGLIAALALADGESHKVAGGIAAATFVLTVGVLHF